MDWYKIAPSYDADGSLLPSSYPSSPTLAGIPCSVQLTMGTRETDQGLRISTFYDGWVEFPTDYGMSLNDKIVWAGPVRTMTLFVTAVTDGAGRGGIFGVQVEERV